jgi:hypothetical protein
VAAGGARPYRARAEMRRRDRGSPWVLAGIVIDGTFWSAREGVEPIRGRLPEAGLVGWSDLHSPIIAADAEAAARVALEVARSSWPDADRGRVPWATGANDT